MARWSAVKLQWHFTEETALFGVVAELLYFSAPWRRKSSLPSPLSSLLLLHHFSQRPKRRYTQSVNTAVVHFNDIQFRFKWGVMFKLLKKWRDGFHRIVGYNVERPILSPRTVFSAAETFCCVFSSISSFSVTCALIRMMTSKASSLQVITKPKGQVYIIFAASSFLEVDAKTLEIIIFSPHKNYLLPLA